MNAAFKVPVVLPRVEVSIDGAGVAAVEVDGEQLQVVEATTRETLPAVLTGLADELGAIRIHVTESDDSQFTDILVAQPATVSAHAPAPQPAGSLRPNEEVQVAFVIGTERADEAGRVAFRLPPALRAATSGRLVLLGQNSGVQLLEAHA